MLAWTRKLLLASALCAALAAANAAPETNDAVEISTAPTWVSPPLPISGVDETASPAASSDHLLYETQLLARGVASEHYERHARRVNQPTALAEVGSIVIAYSPSFQAIGFHTLAIHREGKIIDLLHSVQFRTLAKEDGLAQSVLSGSRSVVVQVPDLRVGDVLEYAYMVKGLNPVFGERPAFALPWNTLNSVKLRRIRLVEASRALVPRMISPRGPEIVDIRHVRSAFGEETIFEGRAVAPARMETFLPRGLTPFSVLSLTPFSSWSEVGLWADELFRSDMTGAPSIKELVGKLNQMTSKRAAVAEAVRFVQEDIRYFSLAIGENSHRPYPPDEILARRFGDCKDKSLLLVSLLRSLGLAAQPVLVSNLRRAQVDRFPPMPNVFDHVIVRFRFDDRDYWIDPTRSSQGLPFDRQSIGLAGAKALPIGEGSNTLTVVPDNGPSTYDIRETITVSSLDAPVVFEIETRMTGALADMIREFNARRSKEAAQNQHAEFFARRYAGARPRHPARISDEADSGALLISEQYEIGDFFRSEGMGKNYALLGAQQLANWLAANVPPNRTLPFAIPSGRARMRYEAEVRFPPSIVGREDPVSNRMTNDVFSLETNRSFRGNQMRFKGELNILRDEISPGEFGDYLLQTRAVRQALMDVVIVSPDNMRADASDIGKSLAMRSIAEQRALIAGIDKVLDSGRLGDAEAAQAYVRRGTARLLLDERTGALADFNSALRLRPSYEAALTGRALAAFRNGRLAAAEEDLTQAITLGAEPINAYLRRGHVRYSGGRYEEALADFEQAAKLNTYGINRDFLLLWKAMTMRALGRPVDSLSGVGYAVGDLHRWPNAVIALIADRVKVSDVLSAADSASADEREANLCEAHYYIGQYHLLKGDRAQAIASFRAALATGVIHYMEYEMASIALGRLGDNGAAR